MPPRKSKHPVPRHPKLRGEWAELQFMARAAGLGFRIAKPFGDCCRYDFILEHQGGFHRVQVKSTIVRDHGSYRCVYYSSAAFRRYTPDDFDFLAAYVIPEDVWYIIPSAVIATTSITLDPGHNHPGNKYHPYQEAWHLLRQPGTFDISACADLEWIDPPSPQRHPEGFQS